MNCYYCSTFSLLLLALLLPYGSIKHFDVLDHSKCTYITFPPPEQPLSAYARRIKRSESFCLPSVSTVELSTIFVTSQLSFFNFFNINTQWIEAQLLQGAAIVFQSNEEWSSELIDNNFTSNTWISYRFPHESLPHSLFSIPPHQHSAPGPMLFFVLKQTSNPISGFTTFHSGNVSFPAIASVPLDDSGKVRSTTMCMYKPNICSNEFDLVQSNAQIYDGKKRYDIEDRTKEIRSMWNTKQFAKTLKNPIARNIVHHLAKIIGYLKSSDLDQDALQFEAQAWSKTQVVKPSVGDVMISHSWAQFHSRPSSVAGEKKYEVRELIPVDYIHDDLMEYLRKSPEENHITKAFTDGPDYKKRASSRLKIVDYINPVLDFCMWLERNF